MLSEFVGHTMDDVSLQDVHRTKSPVPERIPPEPEITFDELMAQIRHIVLTNRIRVTTLKFITSNNFNFKILFVLLLFIYF